jgi:hypothetical protein
MTDDTYYQHEFAVTYEPDPYDDPTSLRIIEELQRDIEAERVQARDRGRLEGALAIALFVIVGFSAATFVGT